MTHVLFDPSWSNIVSSVCPSHDVNLGAHPYYLSWQYNQCFLPMLLNVFLLALIASFSLHCNSKWVWQITTIYLPRYTGFLCPAILKVGESNLTKTLGSKTKIVGNMNRTSSIRKNWSSNLNIWKILPRLQSREV